MNRVRQVFLVEDDLPLAQSTLELLSPLGFECRHFSSAEMFLDFTQTIDLLSQPACLVTDIRLGNMSGMELFRRLQKNHTTLIWPVIFITGHAEVSMAVEAMRSGAYDFVTKPFDPFLLSEKITSALELSHKIQEDTHFLEEHKYKLSLLTAQEEIVMSHVLSNLTNREIAELMTLSSRTVEIHRANLFRKMQVESAIELAKHNERFALLLKLVRRA